MTKKTRVSLDLFETVDIFVACRCVLVGVIG